MLSEDGHMPAPFSEYDIQEVGVCASDLITDGLLVVSGEREDAVYVISASHGYRPVLVMPTKAMIRFKQKNTEQFNPEEVSAANQIQQRPSTVFLTTIWTIIIGVVIGLLVALFSEKLGL